MISSISLRLPQKNCGLFDTGLAGGDTAGATSLEDSIVQAAVYDQAILSLEDLQSLTQVPTPVVPVPQQVAEGQVAITSGLEKLNEAPVYTHEMDWGVDFLDPLGGLDDPLADDNLDAFVNLDTLLMGDTFLGECDSTALTEGNIPEDVVTTEVEVKSIIQFAPSQATELPVSCHKPTEASPPKAPKKASRKRKATKPVTTESLAKQPLVTSLFEIPSSPDHDYSSKRLCPPEEAGPSHQTATPSGTGTGNGQDKVAVRRMKNNVASKRSREQRKVKFAEMDQEADFLTHENERLRTKIVELEHTAKEMKALLVAKMAGKA